MIPMGELLTYPLSSAVSASSSARPPSTSDATLSPLTFFNTLLNDITNWVVILILSLRVVEERVKMITYFVELLDRSVKNICDPPIIQKLIVQFTHIPSQELAKSEFLSFSCAFNCLAESRYFKVLLFRLIAPPPSLTLFSSG